MSRVFYYLDISVFKFAFFYINGLTQDHQDWSYNLSVYQVNTRQYTSSGTFSEFETHLDRLKDMGVRTAELDEKIINATKNMM